MVYANIEQPTAQYGQIVRVSVARSIFVDRTSRIAASPSNPNAARPNAPPPVACRN